MEVIVIYDESDRSLDDSHHQRTRIRAAPTRGKAEEKLTQATLVTRKDKGA